MGKLRPVLRWISAPFGAIVVFGCLGLVAMVVAMSSPGLPSAANLQTRHLTGTPAASLAAVPSPSDIPASQIPETTPSDGGSGPTLPPAPALAPTPRAVPPHDDHHHGKHPGD